MLDFYKDEWEELEKHCGFTDFELQVIKYIKKGWKIPDIAEELYSSAATVKRARTRIFDKITHYIMRKK